MRVTPPGAGGGAPRAANPALASRIGIWRTIVAPAGDDAAMALSIFGRSKVVTRNATFPNATRSSTPALSSSIFAPFKNVPLLDPRSFTCRDSPAVTSSACLREIVGSKTGISHVGARPTMMVAPSRRSNDWVPSGLISRSAMLRRICGSAALLPSACCRFSYSANGSQHCARLVFRLDPLAGGNRILHDARTCLDRGNTIRDHTGADGDG